MLVMITSFDYIDVRMIKYAVALMIIWAISVTYNLVVPGSGVDFANGGFETIVISFYLLLLCFSNERYAKVIINSYIFVSIVVALVIIVVWVICFSSEAAYSSLRQYFLDLQQRTGLSLMAIDYRAILGRKFLTVWYRTAPCMVCALGYCMAQRLESRGKNTVKIVLLVAALVMSGVRANLLSAGLLVAFYIAISLYKKGNLVTMALLSAGSLAAALILAVRFLRDSGSASSAIKTLDFRTYFDIYISDPIRTLLFGWGPGSSFYSGGREQLVNVTELSLLETIRRYGLLSTAVILFGIWFKPFRSKNLRSIGITRYYCYLAVAAYLLCAFTNPYLLDSVGFCALLFYCVWFKCDSVPFVREPNVFGAVT